jgi:ribosomal protein S27E
MESTYENTVGCPDCQSTHTTYSAGAREWLTCHDCGLTESGELGYWQDIPATVGS